MFKFPPASVDVQEQSEVSSLIAQEAWVTDPLTELDLFQYFCQLATKPAPDSEWECT
jgi:hypothetical protein